MLLFICVLIDNHLPREAEHLFSSPEVSMISHVFVFVLSHVGAVLSCDLSCSTSSPGNHLDDNLPPAANHSGGGGGESSLSSSLWWS